MLAAPSSAEVVRAIGSGVPPSLWKRLSYMVVQVVIDESGNAPDQGVIVLAGVLAKAKNWVAMTRKWERAMSAFPHVDEVKFAEITRLRGRFAASGGWSATERDKCLSELIALIAEHAIGYVAVTVRHDEFNRHVRSVASPYRNLMTDAPNVFMAGTTILASLSVMDQARTWDLCDFFFDECPGADALITAMWPDYRKVADDFDFINARGKQRVDIGGVHFMQSSRFVPLQAADLIAGMVRSQQLGKKLNPEFSALKDMPSCVISMSEDAMKDVGRAAERTTRRLTSVFPKARLYPFDQKTAGTTRDKLERKRRRNARRPISSAVRASRSS